MTLTELLIVVAVLVIMLGLGLPMVKTGLEGRRIREASRQLNTYGELAKAQAAETGRPSALILNVQTLPGPHQQGPPANCDVNESLPYVSEVFLAQTPLPYAGDLVGARATISGSTASFNSVYSAQLTSLVRPGDQIRFDYRGVLYDITAVNTATYTITFSGSPLPPNNAVLPYQIYRQPEKSGSMPMEMPPGAVIDLSMSGFGLTEPNLDPFDTIIVGTVTSTVESVVIVFSPTGAMTRVLVNRVNFDSSTNTVTTSTDTYAPTATLHLLVGRIDGVLLNDVVNVNVADDLKTNIENSESLWVSIGHQTGHVTTAENGWTISDPTNMALAREFAQSGKAMGGR